MLLASAVPFNTKVVSLVMPSVADGPLSVVMPVLDGALGAVLSTVTLKLDDDPLTLSALSVAVAVKL